MKAILEVLRTPLAKVATRAVLYGLAAVLGTSALTAEQEAAGAALAEAVVAVACLVAAALVDRLHHRADLAQTPPPANRASGANTASILWPLLLVPLVLAGCGGGLATDLLTYDNIRAAASESAKGVAALDAAVQEADRLRQEGMYGALRESILATAEAPEAERDTLAARIVEAMRQHVANYAENDRRRRDTTAAALDNLAYVAELCDKAKDFTLYRANISAQWKAYLEATARSRLPQVPEANP